MGKKETWTQRTGLKKGDIAFCNGSFQYNHTKHKLNEEVTIVKIKSNACDCIVKNLNGKENVEVSILKKYLEKPVEKIIEKTTDINKNKTAENMKEETTNIIQEENVEENNETVIDENIEKNNEEKDIVEEISDKLVNNETSDVEKMIDSDTIENVIQESSTDNEEKNIEECEKEETVEENNEEKVETSELSVETTIEENLELKDILDVFEEENKENQMIKDVADNLTHKVEEIVDEMKEEMKEEISIIPNLGFKNFFMSNELRESIKEAAECKNHTIISDKKDDIEKFNELHIKKVKSLYNHVPISKSMFEHVDCYKLICSVDYKHMKEFEEYSKKHIRYVELEIFINKDTYRLEKYQFKVVNTTKIKSVIELNLSKLQESDIETYGKNYVRYYEALVKEDEFR